MRKVIVLGCGSRGMIAQKIAKIGLEKNIEILFIEKLEKEIEVVELKPLTTFTIKNIPMIEPMFIDDKIHCVKNFGMNKISKRKKR